MLGKWFQDPECGQSRKHTELRDQKTALILALLLLYALV